MSFIGNSLLLAEEGGSYWFPPAASTFAREVDWLFYAIGWISLVFFVLIVVAMVWFAVKFRRRPGYEGDSRALHNNALEIFWTVVPTLIVIWIFAKGSKGLPTWSAPQRIRLMSTLLLDDGLGHLTIRTERSAMNCTSRLTDHQR